MPNEAKTAALFRNLLRRHGYYGDPDLTVEEQQSDNPKIDKLLKNASKRGGKQGYPDFIIRSQAHSGLLLVVEAKADNTRHQSDTLDNYADFAVDGALLYASFLSKEFDVLAIGVSGETTGQLRVSHYIHLKDEKRAYPIFDDAILPFEAYYAGVNKSNYKFNQDYGNLIAYTKELNETLHAKKIKESQRALLISGILIALKGAAFKLSYKEHSTVEQLVEALYTAIKGQLSSGKITQQQIEVLTHTYSFIRTNPTLTDKKTGKPFLENLIDEIDDEINGFMVTHQYIDTVSQFYTEFLRYANNDKGLGIVLTPPHITDLFSRLAGVDKNSVVFDNCCGTGGFIISPMKRMLVDAKGDPGKEKSIKEHQLIGIEYQDDIYTLLISNLIIHHDGNTNVYWGDCFDLAEKVGKKHHPNIGLLNPPYKTKASDREEFEYILNNLAALTPGGTCIAIVSISCVIEKSAVSLYLRRRILANHTLEAVLSLPEELFHNSKVNTVTCAVILTAHKPHPRGKKTWFAYCRDDGFVKVKNKGRIDANHTWDSIRDFWVSAYQNRDVIKDFSVMREVRAQDEWCVEAYLETDYRDFTYEDYEETVKKYLMFNFMDLSAAYQTGNEEVDEDGNL